MAWGQGVGLLTTWVESTLHPRRFFREAPAGAAKALGYAAVCVAVGGFFSFYWAVVFAAVSGPRDMPGPWAGETPWGGEVLPGGLFLIGAFVAWLVSIPLSLLWLVIGAALAHVSLRVFGDGSAGFEGTFRALAYSTGPVVFSLAPVVGTWVAVPWGFALAVIGLREIHRTDLVRPAAALVTVSLLAVALFLAFVWGELAVPGSGVRRF